MDCRRNVRNRDCANPPRPRRGRFSFFGGRHVITTSELERELQNLGRLARRLMPPLAQKPHLFHESKAELIEAAQRLLDRVRGIAAPDRSFRTAQADTGIAVICRHGRVIPIERRRPSP